MVDQSSFEQDEVTEQLENRWSGQGHRAALNRNIHREESEDVIENRFGEERSQFLRERANGFSVQFRVTTPPRLPGANGHGGRGLVTTPSRNPGHNRASSPSRHGTVIFGPGGRRQVATSGQTNVLRQSFAVQPVRPITAHPRPAVNGNTTFSSTTIQPQPTQAGQNTPKHTSTQAQQYHNQALWYAANPGTLCDEYHERFPDRKIYLGPARDKLIREAVVLADSGDDEQMADYVDTHQDRQWMIECAKIAKSQIEAGDEAAIEEYCVDHPRHRFFLRIAKAFYARKNGPAVVNQEENGSDEVSSLPVQPAPQQSSTSLSATSTAHKHVSSDASSSDTRGHSSDIVDDGDTNTAPSTPPTPLGLIATTFFDAAGKFLGFYHVDTSAPIQMTVNLNSRDADFNPCDLIVHLDALAESMKAMSRGSADNPLRRIDSLAGNMVDVTRGSKTNCKLEGATLGEDGLWVMDEL